MLNKYIRNWDYVQNPQEEEFYQTNYFITLETKLTLIKYNYMISLPIL